MNKTKIDWATMSWNPVTGCRHGCPYCYARRTAHRFDAGCADPDPLACTAIGYVAEFAVDKCRFIPLPGGGQK